MNDYPENWREIAKEVKDRAGWRCELCGHEHDPETGYTLTVHHLDGDPSNCDPENLVALCQRCHLRKQVYLEWALRRKRMEAKGQLKFPFY